MLCCVVFFGLRFHYFTSVSFKLLFLIWLWSVLLMISYRSHYTSRNMFNSFIHRLFLCTPKIMFDEVG